MRYAFDIINTTTGEVVKTYETDAVLVIPIRRRRLNHKRWIMGDQAFFYKLAKDEELTLTDMRVLSYLISVMDFENYVAVPQKEIASNLRVTERAVRKSISKLKRKGIIKTKKVGRFNAYMLNPEAVFKGKIEKLDRRILEFRFDA